MTMKALVKGRCGIDKVGGIGSLVVNVGDVNLRASMTDATFANGPSLNGLSLSLEKPGNFIIDYDVPKQDVQFQFMNTVMVLDKPLNMTYTHWMGENWSALDGMLVLDSANRLSASYVFDSGNCKLKYTYAPRGTSTFEPSYDFAKNSWDFTVSKRLYGDDIVRASYQTSSRVLGVEWSKISSLNGTFKVSASLCLAEEKKVPKLTAESTWNFEM